MASRVARDAVSEAAGPAVGGSAVQDKARGSSSWQRWTSQHDKDILALALPAALALAADPLLGMVDTALIGRLGADELVSVLQSKRGAQMQRSCVPGAWFPCCTHAHFVALLGICWASHLLGVASAAACRWPSSRTRAAWWSTLSSGTCLQLFHLCL